jgi:hypothetical protein
MSVLLGKPVHLKREPGEGTGGGETRRTGGLGDWEKSPN